MNESDRLALKELASKVEQHEATIAQLLEIIAATNRKISELTSYQKKRDYFHSQV
ncbi:hypothetical protein [Oceanobacillus saliphilus]|uniref:hypothetical protein n=1 Tax=Oceanobacillus saliphilus TaxID=2925834 RepID=UPI00201E6ADE|nr:hypothetical protein [Oceanobacillus saliphilus]